MYIYIFISDYLYMLGVLLRRWPPRQGRAAGLLYYYYYYYHHYYYCYCRVLLTIITIITIVLIVV